MPTIWNFELMDIFYILPLCVAIYFICRMAFDNGGKSLIKSRWKYMLPYKRLQMILMMGFTLSLVTYMLRMILMVILY